MFKMCGQILSLILKLSQYLLFTACAYYKQDEEGQKADW